MDIIIVVLISCLCVDPSAGFWDVGTTTFRHERDADEGRTSFFRWQWTYVPNVVKKMFPPYNYWDWSDVNRRRRTAVVAGLSIDWQSITTAAILNRRCVLSSANALYPHLQRQYDVRIWTAGWEGRHNTPYRYRVHRIHILYPRSGNPEHCHGPYCAHQPRHDVAVVLSRDQMYLYDNFNAPYFGVNSYFHPIRCRLDPPKGRIIYHAQELWFAGSGFEYITHITENYKIFWRLLYFSTLVDCSVVLPKWWGKFICLKNWQRLAGVQNGGPFFIQEWMNDLGPAVLIGIGCFEIRFNDDRVFVFTDLRYYFYRIQYLAGISLGSYYDYSYPHWMVQLGTFRDAGGLYISAKAYPMNDIMILG